MVAKWGARIMAHFFRMALDMPDGPGALWGLTFVSVSSTLSGVNTGNLEWGTVGGLCSANGCSFLLRGLSGGKNVSASILDFCSLVVVWVLSGLKRAGVHCLP